MDKRIFAGKTREEAISAALVELHETEDNIYIKDLETKKRGLFKSPTIEIEITTKEDIVKFIEDYLKKVISNIGISCNIEITKNSKNIIITIISDNNALLIGKAGRTMDALTIVLKQAIYTKYGFYFNFLLDIGEYKEKQQYNLEKLAKTIAREVMDSKIEAKLDPMNSYERRIIHNALTSHNYVTTSSTGVEPNRCIIIKPKGE